MAPEELILRLDQEIEAELHPFTVGGAPSAELDAAKAQRRSYALRTIKCYLEFLLIIQGRNTVASANYLDNVRQQLEEIDRQVRKGLTTWPETERSSELWSEWHPLSLQVQLEQESFYIFAKMLLDKVAHAVGVYFGPAPKCSYQSHDALTKCFEKYCELLGLPRHPELSQSMEKLKIDVADFRDKVISHEKSSRAIVMRPLVEGPDGTVRLSMSYVRPREGDRNIQARPVNEVLAEIADYILLVLQFVRTNSAE